jgi:hypothetical protein
LRAALSFVAFNAPPEISQITHLEETPLRLHSFDDEEGRSSTLLIGDHAGCLTAMTFPPFCFTARPFKEHAT